MTHGPLRDVKFAPEGGCGGGGIAVLGPATLNLSRSTLSQNRATPDANFPFAVVGGGLANIFGNAALINDTFNANVAGGRNTPHGGLGGAIFQAGFEQRLADTTTDNAVLKLPDIATIDKRSVKPGTSIDLNTIAGNVAEAGLAGGVFRANGDMTVQNTIVANNQAANAGTLNCAGVLAGNDGEYNLESANTCNFSAAKHDLNNTNPVLGALANNTGPAAFTQTMALLAGSPAIDSANPKCPVDAGEKTDERGVTRPQGTACDIGAYEFVPQAQSSPTPTPATTPVPSPPVTGTGTGLTARHSSNPGPLAAFLAGLAALLAAGAGFVVRSSRA